MQCTFNINAQKSAISTQYLLVHTHILRLESIFVVSRTELHHKPKCPNYYVLYILCILNYYINMTTQKNRIHSIQCCIFYCYLIVYYQVCSGLTASLLLCRLNYWSLTCLSPTSIFLFQLINYFVHQRKLHEYMFLIFIVYNDYSKCDFSKHDKIDFQYRMYI